MSTQATGAYGENLARAYLEEKGYTFITANWRCKGGEVDLIMREKETLVFVEVRLRQPTTFGAGADTVAHDKQRKLIRAAKTYQQQAKDWGDARFDVVSIINYFDREPDIDHIEHAFMVE